MTLKIILWKVTGDNNSYCYCIYYITSAELSSLEMLFHLLFATVHEVIIIRLIEA